MDEDIENVVASWQEQGVPPQVQDPEIPYYTPPSSPDVEFFAPPSSLDQIQSLEYLQDL